MTEFDEARSEEVSASAPPRQSRYFWTTAALAIGAMLLVCTTIILIASTRS
jgi:hypothetical protein